MPIQSVRIGSIDVPVVRKRLRNKYGQAFDEPSPSIEIKASLKGGMEANTILHEAIHIIDWTNSIGLSEAQTLALEHAICGFIRDNPELVKAIQHG